MESFFRRTFYDYVDDYISSDDESESDESDDDSVIIEPKLYLEYDLKNKKVLCYSCKGDKLSFHINGILEKDISFKIIAEYNSIKIWVYDLFYDIDTNKDPYVYNIKSFFYDYSIDDIFTIFSLDTTECEIIC